MENEIKKLIEKWKTEYLNISVDGEYTDPDIYVDKCIQDLQSLLEFKQKNCCGNFVIEEVTHRRIELAAYNRGYDDGFAQAKLDLTGK